jgi:hypothetical protein
MPNAMTSTTKIKFIILILSILTTLAKGQNLIPNPSFETYTLCPNAGSEIYSAVPWTGPTTNSSDYFNVCSPTRGVPRHGAYAFQYPKTGNAYAGIWGLNGIGTNYREYAQTSLLSPLVAGKCYYIEFYINLYNNLNFGINNIAAHISSTAFTSTLSFPGNILNLTPHAIKFGNPVITDTLNWTKISGIYDAIGGEEYIIIGNFFDDLNTDTVTMQGGYPGAYYYIDDVSLVPIDSMNLSAFAGNDTTIIFGDSTFIGQEIFGLDCNWYNNNQLIATNISGIYVTPTVTTTYVVEQSLCGNITYDSLVVTVNPVGVHEYNKQNSSSKIYPNPFTDKTTFEYINPNKESCTLTIYDIQGQLKRTINNITANKVIIEKESLTNGLYFYILKSKENIVTTGKLIVE